MVMSSLCRSNGERPGVRPISENFPAFVGKKLVLVNPKPWPIMRKRLGVPSVATLATLAKVQSMEAAAAGLASANARLARVKMEPSGGLEPRP